MKSVLVVDDDPNIRDVVDYALQKAGFTCRHAGDGREALESFETHAPDFLVLDVGMPDLDGLEVCRQIRKTSEVPILFLSARDEEVDRIVGLEIGGDDYVTKPFSPRELVARVQAIMKRSKGQGDAPPEACENSFGVLCLNVERRTCLVKGALVDLTGTEFEILRMLMRRPGIVYSRDQILQQAWPHNVYVSDRTIDSHVRNLRGKLRAAGCGDAIRTVHSVGFQLAACTGEA